MSKIYFSLVTFGVALGVLFFSSFFWLPLAGAAPPTGVAPAPGSGASTGLSGAINDDDRVNVDAIKEKYWAKGDEAELGVVQNRLYTKVGRFEVGTFAGMIMSDPFLSVTTLGASVGYHFSEYFAVHVFGWKAFSGPSSALTTFIQTEGATANTNQPKSYLGSEASASLLYGKLSLIGKKIIYYDFHLLGGLGVTNTESGADLTGHVGIGQQVYLTKSASIRLDYRLMPYEEQIKEKVIPTKLGQVVDKRTNWSNSVTLGITFLLGGNGV